MGEKQFSSRHPAIPSSCAGGAVFARGKALNGIGITIAPADDAPGKDREKVMGDKKVSSRHPAFMNLGVTASSLVASFQNERRRPPSGRASAHWCARTSPLFPEQWRRRRALRPRPRSD